MRSDRERLLDILEAISNIERYSQKGLDVFMRDELVQTWAVHHIQIIGEAAARVSPALKERTPGIPWVDIVSMRNLLVHQYFGIDLDEVWNTISDDFPGLKTRIEEVLKEIPE